MNISKDNVIGKVVAEDYRAASVFKSFGIDFCCKGNRSIEEVCEQANIGSDTVIHKLNQVLIEKENLNNDYQSWDIDLLADYIEKKHHRYVAGKIPEIKTYLNKVASVHGARHPELIEIENLFTASAQELLFHMEKEEKILFPQIRKMMQTEQQKMEFNKPPFGTVENPIQMMMQEHENEGDRFRKIEELSDNYTPPLDACTTYRVAFALLKEFEEDLHLHIHLENNILFPKAIELEKELSRDRPVLIA
jgi:regulator of cell morphogenesis and NO signaling